MIIVTLVLCVRVRTKLCNLTGTVKKAEMNAALSAANKELEAELANKKKIQDALKELRKN